MDTITGVADLITPGNNTSIIRWELTTPAKERYQGNDNVHPSHHISRKALGEGRDDDKNDSNYEESVERRVNDKRVSDNEEVADDHLNNKNDSNHKRLGKRKANDMDLVKANRDDEDNFNPKKWGSV